MASPSPPGAEAEHREEIAGAGSVAQSAGDFAFQGDGPRPGPLPGQPLKGRRAGGSSGKEKDNADPDFPNAGFRTLSRSRSA